MDTKTKKKIWLINPYGPIPSEAWRDYSFTIFGNYLSQRGFEVIWWTSNFSHHFKKYRSKDFKEITVKDNFKIKLIPSPSYKKNIGIGRVFRDWIFSYRTYKFGKKDKAPDLIIYSESPLSFGYAGPALAKYHNCKLVYDQMDLWPELIVDVFPIRLKKVINFFLLPVFRKRQKIFKSLDGVIALAEPYLNKAFEACPSLRDKPSEIIYNGIDLNEFRKLMKPSKSLTIPFFSHENINVIFAGSLGPSYDIENILNVAKILEISHPKIQFLIAGDGPEKKKVQKAEKKSRNLTYLGKLKPSELCAVLNFCDVGLAAYSSSSNVEMPDKFYDYTAAGLAIICSLKGEVLDKINGGNAGLEYEAGNLDSLKMAILKITSDGAFLNRLKSSSYDLAKEFSSENQNKKLLKFVKKIIADNF